MKQILDIYSIDIGSSRITLSEILNRNQNSSITENAFGMTVAKWGSFLSCLYMMNNDPKDMTTRDWDTWLLSAS